MASTTTTTQHSITSTATEFFDACETGKGWEVCSRYCHPDASFGAQCDALAEIRTLEAYTEWMKAILTPLPDARYELRAFATDESRNAVIGFGVFRGTHTGPGGPVSATGRSIEAEYVYIMEFDGDRIRHMTKVWNDGHSLRQLGWA